MIEVREIVKEYGTKKILNSVSFFIAPGDKISLVAPNGVGKTTLLNIISGEDDPTSGEIIKTGVFKDVTYFKQELGISSLNEYTILEYLSSNLDVDLYKIEKMLVLFSVEKPLDAKMAHLSAGQQTKVALIKFLLLPGDLLILDEPTNNLDFKTISLLEQWIRQSKKTFIITSHDRKFLATLCTRVLEIDRKDGSVIDRRGSYKNYLKDRVNEKKDHRFKYKLYLHEEKRLIASAGRIRERSGDERLKNKSSVSSMNKERKQKKAFGAAKNLERRSEALIKVEKPIDFEPPKFAWIHPESIEVDDIKNYSISLEDVRISRVAEETLLEDINLNISYSTRICILGLNGAGKSTLISSIIERTNLVSGNLSVGECVVFSSIVQHSYAMEAEGSVLEYFSDKHNIDEAQAKEILENTDLGDDILKPLSAISSGQKMRIFLAGMGMAKANTLILDEPTNHLDIDTLEALEYVLNFFPGNVILVTHDRLFLEKIENFVFYKIEDNTMKKIEDLPAYISMGENISKSTISQFIMRVERVKN